MLKLQQEELFTQIDNGEKVKQNFTDEVAHLRRSVVVTNSVATELQEAIDKIRSLEYALQEKEEFVAIQKNDYEQMLTEQKNQTQQLTEEIEIHKENERHFQIAKKQN